MTLGEKNNNEWTTLVKQARNSILISKRDPVKLLTDLFELYKDDFDVTNFEAKQPLLYKILQTFCSNPPETNTELVQHSGELVKFFKSNQAEIRRADIDMYYALLNFIDFLKSKHIYFTILNHT